MFDEDENWLDALDGFVDSAEVFADGMKLRDIVKRRIEHSNPDDNIDLERALLVLLEDFLEKYRKPGASSALNRVIHLIETVIRSESRDRGDFDAADRAEWYAARRAVLIQRALNRS